MTDDAISPAEEAGMIAPWRLFPVHVVARQRLSPSFTRITFGGDELDTFADNGFDQRIKLVLPAPGQPMTYPPAGADWYGHWRSLPDQHRNPVRTYTVRAVRRQFREVDVDVALHGDAGPASRWATAVAPGDMAALVGPDAGFGGDHGGLEFAPGDPTRPLLLAGDETAVPAIMSIVERLPAGARGEVILEVPHAADVLPGPTRPRLRFTWLGRDGVDHGSLLVPVVKDAADRLLQGRVASAELPDVDVDRDILWEVTTEFDGEVTGDADRDGLYAWLAGEAGVIKALRRHLVAERGLDRRSVAFMGYWRQGRSEAT